MKSGFEFANFAVHSVNMTDIEEILKDLRICCPMKIRMGLVSVIVKILTERYGKIEYLLNSKRDFVLLQTEKPFPS